MVRSYRRLLVTVKIKTISIVIFQKRLQAFIKVYNNTYLNIATHDMMSLQKNSLGHCLWCCIETSKEILMNE